MNPHARPRVSLLIPLYRSVRFLEIICANIESVGDTNAEFLVSDRHLADDALEQLERRYGRDPRVRFLRGRDELDWVAHFNLLLREARGEYACFMPHDDTFLPGWVPELAACLDREPDTIVAYGRVQPEVAPGHRPPAPRWVSPPLWEGPWSPAVAVDLLGIGNLAMAFRGVLRREAIIRRRLFIRRPRQTVGADYFWVFGLALVGRLRYVPSCTCIKRYYPQSTHAQHRTGVRNVLSGGLTCWRYLLACCRPPTLIPRLGWRVTAWTLDRAGHGVRYQGHRAAEQLRRVPRALRKLARSVKPGA